MSAGHAHHTHNRLAHTRELHKLLTVGGAPALMRRWNKFDVDRDCPYLCGYNIWGTTRFADRDFVRALFDPAYAEHLIGEAINTGLSPEDTLDCLLWHEAVEKVLLDADNPLDTYPEAHEFATAGEHDRVRHKGVTPVRYERGLERIIKFCLSKPLKSADRDYSCAPALDDPDENDRRIVKELRRLGVTDAFKISKTSVDYGLARGPEHCAGCSMWQARPGSMLSPCDLVDGLIRDTHVCERYEPRGEHEEAQQDRQGPQAGSADEGAERPVTVH